MRILKSIMLVDDDSTTNFLHEMLIQEMNITNELFIASNGKDALEKLHDLCYTDDRCPDLILLDINMPGMDGFEFLQEFNNKDFKKTPPAIVVMVTSSSNPGDIRKAIDLNAQDCLSKPLRKEDIERILHQYF